MIPLAILALSVLSTCHVNGELPDAACTPGAVETTDLRVICGRSTETRRHVTEGTRRRVFAEYAIPWANHRKYEVDHLVPLEVGGGNAIPNLWPEPLDEAHEKDKTENRAHALVCSGQAVLADVQKAFATDWRTVPH